MRLKEFIRPWKVEPLKAFNIPLNFLGLSLALARGTYGGCTAISSFLH